MRGGRGRAVVVLGATPSVVDTMDFFETASTGNATDFGNALQISKRVSEWHQLEFFKGPPSVNIMEYVTISSSMILVITIEVLQMVMDNVRMEQEDYWQVDI